VVEAPPSAGYGEDDGLQSARLRARRLAIELSSPDKQVQIAPGTVPLIDVKQQTLTRELMAAAGKAPETSAEKAAGEKRLIDVAMDASLSTSVIGLHALETAGKLTLVDFKKAASAVQVAELFKQSKIGLPTGASSLQEGRVEDWPPNRCVLTSRRPRRRSRWPSCSSNRRLASQPVRPRRFEPSGRHTAPCNAASSAR